MRYTDQHEWVRIEGNMGTVGITEYAAQQLGDVVFVELPAVGKILTQGGEAAVVESVKAASEVYAPLSGEVVEINQDLEIQPDLVNMDPLGSGWFFKIKLMNSNELNNLMEESAYLAFIEKIH